MNYSFESLNDKEFENLVVDVIGQTLDTRIERFKAGKDGGVDGRFFNNENGEVILQCKHWLKSGMAKLLKSLETEEVEKVRKLNPKRYIFVTSLPLSHPNKKKIMALFQPYILRADDIYGSEDLNQLLATYPDIEKRHYKLWIASANVLQRFLNEAIYGRSNEFVTRLKESSRIYVYSDNHKRTVEKLKQDHVVVITGEPGSGKTTIAGQICLELIKQEYTLFVIQDDLKEAESVFARDEKQVFYFDDFLGRNYLEAFSGNSESAICQFMARIKRAKNKKFVLTSRTNIFSQGCNLGDLFKQEKVKNTMSEVRIDELSYLDKAYILYNHIWFGNLLEDFVEELYKDKKYKQIIYHKNFNPRLISFITDVDLFDGVDVQDYWGHIHSTLSNPKDVWANLFDSQLSQSARELVALVVFNGKEIGEDKLLESYIRLHNGSPQEDNLYRVIKNLVGSLLVRKISKNDNVVLDVYNPSVADFVIGRYLGQTSFLTEVFKALLSSESLKVLNRLFAFEKVKYQVLNTIQSEILRLIVGEGLGGISEDYLMTLGACLDDESELEKLFNYLCLAEVNVGCIRRNNDALSFVRNFLANIHGARDSELLSDILMRCAEYSSEDEYHEVVEVAEMFSEECAEKICTMLREEMIESWKDYVTECAIQDDWFSSSDVDWEMKSLDNYEGIVSERIDGIFDDAKLPLNSSELSSIVVCFDQDNVVDHIMEREEFENELYYSGRSSSTQADLFEEEIDDLFNKN